MQVCPRSGGGRIVCRSSGLDQSGHDSERHSGSGSVQDSLIQSQADRLSECCQDLACQSDVGVFQVRVANGKVATDLPAVHFSIEEAQIQLVEVRAAVSPNRFRDGSHHDRAAFACDLADVNVLIELGIFHDIFADQAQHDLRDSQADVAQRSLLADAGSNFAQEVLDVLTREKCVSFLCVHSEELSRFHVLIFLSFLRGLLRLRLYFFSFLEVVELLLESSDLVLELFLFCFKVRLVRVEFLDLLGYGVTLFLSRDLFDGSLEVFFSFLELFRSRGQLFKGCALIVQALF